ncbi:cellulase family glycosylhydrolase [Gordonia sp. DT219]|uniref:cellulase family glycosylhydrolase n=1 Tax=Gordonia sp. DT219 TaxID=3416658 RepID=UPI003CF00E98
MHALRSPLTRRVGAGALAVGIAGSMAFATLWSFPSAEPSRAVNLPVALASVADEPTPLGVTDDQIYRISDGQLRATLDSLRTLGVTDIRVGAPWRYLERGAAGWSRLDAIVDGARARGMHVVIVASVSSRWTGATSTASNPPAAFAAFAKALAARYKGKVAGYEIWNQVGATEPNSVVPSTMLRDLLAAAINAIRAVDPGTPVSGQQVTATVVATPPSAPAITGSTVAPVSPAPAQSPAAAPAPPIVTETVAVPPPAVPAPDDHEGDAPDPPTTSTTSTTPSLAPSTRSSTADPQPPDTVITPQSAASEPTPPETVQPEAVHSAGGDASIPESTPAE